MGDFLNAVEAFQSQPMNRSTPIASSSGYYFYKAQELVEFVDAKREELRGLKGASVISKGAEHTIAALGFSNKALTFQKPWDGKEHFCISLYRSVSDEVTDAFTKYLDLLKYVLVKQPEKVRLFWWDKEPPMGFQVYKVKDCPIEDANGVYKGDRKQKRYEHINGNWVLKYCDESSRWQLSREDNYSATDFTLEITVQLTNTGTRSDGTSMDGEYVKDTTSEQT